MKKLASLAFQQSQLEGFGRWLCLVWVTASSDGVSREALSAAFDTIDAALDKGWRVDCDAFSTRDALERLERCERVRLRLPTVEHRPRLACATPWTAIPA